MKSQYYLLLLPILLAILTRFYQLGQAPAGLYLDEAGQGYSAYSLLKTGRDEFGKAFPVVFRSFTDFKTPVYIYLIVPLIPVFGLTPLAVRLPSAVFSLLTFPILYYLIRKLAPKSYSLYLAILSLLLLAISPWHILFGRTNFECNVALLFLLTGILFFYRSLAKPNDLVWSALMFALAVPAYHSQRIIAPLVVLFLFLRHRRRLLAADYRLPIAKAILVGLIISLPTLSIVSTPGFLARASTLNIFAGQGLLSALKEFSALYFSYFSPRNMFFLGDYGPRSSFPGLPAFYLWQLPFYLSGLYLLFKSPITNHKSLIIFLLLASPIPAALTRDPYSTIRALPLVIPQIIIISSGLLSFINRKPARPAGGSYLLYRVFTVLFVFLIIYSVGQLYSSGIILNEYYRAPYWDYGWRQVVEVIQKRPDNLPVVIDAARNEPYIHLLFFLRFDPADYVRANPEVSPADYYTDLTRLSVHHIGSITTRGINWQQDLQTEQYLLGDALAISADQIRRHNLQLISEVKYPDGSPAFRIVKTHPNSNP